MKIRSKIVLLLIWVLTFVNVSQAAAREPVRAKHGMVVSREKHATAAGVSVLQHGGNAMHTGPFAAMVGGQPARPVGWLLTTNH